MDPLNKREKRDSNWVLQTYGVGYSQYYYYQGLRGDSADCVPGVERCGPEKAAEIVKHYAKMSDLLENWDRASTTFPVLKDQKNAFDMSYELVNLHPLTGYKSADKNVFGVNKKSLEAFICRARDL